MRCVKTKVIYNNANSMSFVVKLVDTKDLKSFKDKIYYLR